MQIPQVVLAAVRPLHDALLQGLQAVGRQHGRPEASSASEGPKGAAGAAAAAGQSAQATSPAGARRP
eukprot:13391413-Alexandrium_andersonii.AAC.1